MSGADYRGPTCAANVASLQTQLQNLQKEFRDLDAAKDLDKLRQSEAALAAERYKTLQLQANQDSLVRERTSLLHSELTTEKQKLDSETSLVRAEKKLNADLLAEHKMLMTELDTERKKLAETNAKFATAQQSLAATTKTLREETDRHNRLQQNLAVLRKEYDRLIERERELVRQSKNADVKHSPPPPVVQPSGVVQPVVASASAVVGAGTAAVNAAMAAVPSPVPVPVPAPTPAMVSPSLSVPVAATATAAPQPSGNPISRGLGRLGRAFGNAILAVTPGGV